MPGETQKCYCPDNRSAQEQTCNADGKSWSTCNCTTYAAWCDETSGLCWQDPQKDGYDNADGGMIPADAVKYCRQVAMGGYTDWRLPTFDPAHQRDDATPLNEMPYVLYTELGNNYGGEPYTYGPFTNVLTDDNPDGVRWSSLEYDPGNAWNFYFTCG